VPRSSSVAARHPKAMAMSCQGMWHLTDSS
jgi:hypothetical protein